MKKMLFLLLILLVISGCQTIQSSPKLDSLENIVLTQEEIKDLGIQTSDTTDFKYTAQAYYSDYPSVKHSEGFQGSFSRRYYFYEVGNVNYIEIKIAILDSSENAVKHYESQLEIVKGINEIFGIETENNNLYSFGNVSFVSKNDELEQDNPNFKEAKGNKIYFVKNNYFVKIETIISYPDILKNKEVITTGENTSLEKLAEIAEIIESRLSVVNKNISD